MALYKKKKKERKRSRIYAQSHCNLKTEESTHPHKHSALDLV